MAIGIICEYNPLHRGHILHMELSRAAIGKNAPIICAMSGSVTQRGEPAVFDKWSRAAAAVRAGANLVIELPAPLSCASAEVFARAGVDLLAATGVVGTLSFGSESGDTPQIPDTADISAYLAAGFSWAEAMRRVLGRDVLPNDLLGAYYLQSLRGTGIKPLIIRRDNSLPCASELRRNLVGPSLSENFRVTLAVLGRLTERDWAAVADVSEGLEHRLLAACRQAESWGGFMSAIRTKRYPQARLRRIILRAFLGIPKGFAAPRYIRVLAFDGAGAALLKTMKKAASLPIVTKPAAAKGDPLFDLECQITDRLAYVSPQLYGAGRELTTSPVYIAKSFSL
ncbi:UPF0348 protein [Clostridia bacterium]|nr:UPF0348 protein [Clostridia bacterium]